MVEMIRSSFPAFEGNGINPSCQLDVAKLGTDLDGDIPADVKAVALDSLKNPSLLLQSVNAYTSRMKMLVHRETEKIDIRADAELLRYYFFHLTYSFFKNRNVRVRYSCHIMMILCTIFLNNF
jgi:hypothetical protein